MLKRLLNWIVRGVAASGDNMFQPIAVYLHRTGRDIMNDIKSGWLGPSATSPK